MCLLLKFFILFNFYVWNFCDWIIFVNLIKWIIYVFKKYFSKNVANNTCNKAEPITGTRNPLYKNSKSCFCTKECATWATALQNSKELIIWESSEKSLMSSTVSRCQSSVSISKVRGSTEYKPLNPVAKT